VPSPSGPADLLADLARGLGSLGVSWYVFGAQAVLIWGRPRLTADVDVTVRLGAHSTEQLLDHVSRAGFGLRFPTTTAFVRDTRVLPLVHARSGMAVDVVLAGPGLEELFLARAVAVAIGGTSVPVIAPEDLVVTKILAGRPKDLDDVAGILHERGGQLDIAQIDDTLHLIEDALGQSDLRRQFDDLLARWRDAMR
jgi:hypothetical protein